MARLITSDAQLAAQLPALEAAGRIALDTEFHTERWFYPRLMLLQLRADRQEPLLVDPLAVSLAPLAQVLARVPVLVHGGQQDVHILHRMLGVRMNVVLDTQIAAGFVGAGYPVRLQALVQRYTGGSMDKGETLSDWAARPLTDAQLRYAAEDVLVLDALADALLDALARTPHTDAMRAAVADMVDAACAPPDDAAAWMRVPGAAQLDPRERACLRGLVAWRDREARARDVPRHTLASDAILFDLARRQPASAAEMRTNRRMPGHLSRQESGAVLAILRDPGEPPPALRPDRAGMELLRAAARIIEGRTGVPAELLLPDAAARRLLADPDAGWGNLPAWRRALLGDDLRDYVQGTRGFELPAGSLGGGRSAIELD